MIVNAFSVLDAFLVLLRLLVAMLLLGLGAGALSRWRRSTTRTAQEVEDRYYLLFSLATLLLCLSVLSWPVFYLTLQSYVDAWPGVMCVYGVTRIGTGSVGPSRFLPDLVAALQVTRPALVFLSGAWFVLYLVNRRTATAPLLGTVLVALIVLGVVAVADAAAEALYLLIPKKEEFLSAGCCTEAFDSLQRYSRLLPGSILGERYQPWLFGIYVALNTILGASLWLVRRARAGVQTLLLAGAALSLAVNALFLVEIASPRLLRLPYHHCPYDLLPRAPESLVAIALFFLGCFSVGWACVASWFARHPEAEPGRDELVRRLLRLGAVGYLGSMLMMLVELFLAG